MTATDSIYSHLVTDALLLAQQMLGEAQTIILTDSCTKSMQLRLRNPK